MLVPVSGMEQNCLNLRCSKSQYLLGLERLGYSARDCPFVAQNWPTRLKPASIRRGVRRPWFLDRQGGMLGLNAGQSVRRNIDP